MLRRITIRNTLLFTNEFDGQLLHPRAPAEDLGSENELWCGVSDLSAIQAMAMAATSDALKEHHKAECERLHPLEPADHLPLPCSCNQYCTAHGLSSQGAVCLWCAGPLQSARHGVHNGWRNSSETRYCDICPLRRAEILPRGQCRLDCYKCGFDICVACARMSTLTG